MCKALEDIKKNAERQGVREGIKQGVKKGIEQGETILASLMNQLLSEGRTEDAKLAAVDEEARERFYREYHIIV